MLRKRDVQIKDQLVIKRKSIKQYRKIILEDIGEQGFVEAKKFYEGIRFWHICGTEKEIEEELEMMVLFVSEYHAYVEALNELLDEDLICPVGMALPSDVLVTVVIENEDEEIDFPRVYVELIPSTGHLYFKSKICDPSD